MTILLLFEKILTEHTHLERLYNNNRPKCYKFLIKENFNIKTTVNKVQSFTKIFQGNIIGCSVIYKGQNA